MVMGFSPRSTCIGMLNGSLCCVLWQLDNERFHKHTMIQSYIEWTQYSCMHKLLFFQTTMALVYVHEVKVQMVYFYLGWE